MLKTSRRQFLKHSIAASTAIAVCGSNAKVLGANNRLRIAVAGGS